jgi:hypothetical protein
MANEQNRNGVVASHSLTRNSDGWLPCKENSDGQSAVDKKSMDLLGNHHIHNAIGRRTQDLCPAALYLLTLRLLVAVSGVNQGAWHTNQLDSFLKYMDIREDTAAIVRRVYVKSAVRDQSC